MARRTKRRRAKRVSARRRQQHKQEQFGSRTITVPDNVSLFKVSKEKWIRISIIPYVLPEGHKNPIAKHDFDAGDLYWERTYYVHKNIGPDNRFVVCPKKSGFSKRCPICEEIGRIHRDPAIDDDEAKDLKTQERQLFNIVDLDNDEEGVQVWDIPNFNFGATLDDEVKASDEDEENDYFWDPDDGRDLKVRMKEESYAGRPFYQASRIDFKPRKPIPDELLDSAVDLDGMINVLSYEKLTAILFQTEDEDDEDDDDRDAVTQDEDEEDEKPKRRRRKKPEPEEDEDADDGDDDEADEEEEKPKRRRGRPKKEEVEEEEEEKSKRRRGRPKKEDADEDEEEEKPTRPRRRPKKEEPEEEEKPKRSRKKKTPTAEDAGIEKGDSVFYEGEEYTVFRISKDGTSLTLLNEDSNERLTAIGVDDLDTDGNSGDDDDDDDDEWDGDWD